MMYLSQQFRDELFTTLQEHDDSGTLVWEISTVIDPYATLRVLDSTAMHPGKTGAINF
jgi:hypothetical protein